MINTRISIFESIRNKIKQLKKHGGQETDGFKTIFYAVILNDMKEWAEYVPDEENRKKIVDILNRYILEHKDFQIERFVDEPDLYKNVNLPQDNTTWRRIWDNKNYKHFELPYTQPNPEEHNPEEESEEQ